MSTWAIIPADEDVIHSSHKYIDKIMGKNGKWHRVSAASNSTSFIKKKKKKKA